MGSRAQLIRSVFNPSESCASEPPAAPWAHVCTHRPPPRSAARGPALCPGATGRHGRDVPARRTTKAARLGLVVRSGAWRCTTAARALAALLPQAPFVTLPLAASLEQLVGTLSIEDALQSGAVRLSPGLVARAHQGTVQVHSRAGRGTCALVTLPLIGAPAEARA